VQRGLHIWTPEDAGGWSAAGNAEQIAGGVARAKS